MVRRILPLVICLCALCLTTRASAAAAPTALDTRLDLKCDGVPLSDLLADFRKTAGIAIRPDWEALKEAAIHRREPISFNLHGVRARTILTLLCHLTTTRLADRHEDIVWEWHNSAVVLTTLHNPRAPIETRLYDLPEVWRSDQWIEWGTQAVKEICYWDCWCGHYKPPCKVVIEGKKLSVTAPSIAHRRLERILRLVRNGTTPEDWALVLDLQFRSALDANTVTVDFQNKPFFECIDVLAQQTQLPLIIHTNEFRLANIPCHAPITLSLKNVPASKALSQILAQLPADRETREKPVLHIINNEVGCITTAWAADRSFWGDDQARYAIAIDLTPAVFARLNVRSVPQDKQKEFEAAATEFASALRRIDPDTWIDNGGKVGRIRFVTDTRLLIIHDYDTLLKIASILNVLPEAALKLLPVPSTPGP